MTTITNNELTDDVLEYVLAVVEDRYENRKSNAGEDDRIILALRELQKRRKASKEPVRYLNKFSGTCVTLEQQPNASDDVAVYMPLFAAPPAPVVPDDLRRAFEAVARLNNEMYRWTSCMSYNGSYVGEPEGLLKRNIREIEHIMDSCCASMLNGGKS